VEPGFTCAGNPSQCAPTRCGDGIQAVSTDATVVGEACDDGDTDPGDGCDGSCALEPGWDCQGAAPTVCTSVCGDGLRVGAEVCDGADFGGQTCGDQGYDGGVLLCDPGCGQVDPRGCFDCGDGVCSPGEPGHCAADCPVARVRGSAQFACALRADGTVRCWGMNGSSQLGLAADYVPRYLPSRVPGITGAVDLAVGDRHACVVLGSGAVWCWGVNDSGQLGIGETSTHRPPVQVPGLATAVAVAAGGWHTCALLADGTVRCFGSNHSGQLGDGTQEDRASPVTVAGLGNVASLAAGWNHTCARLVDGAVRCWGDNGEGQLGDGTTNPALHPVAVVGIDRALEVSAGGAHTCALGAGGVPWCWGANWAGQVGNGSLDAQPTPVAVGLTGIVSLSTGAFFTCAVDADGATSCWGNDEEGQLGDGTITSAQPTPVPASLLPLAAAQVGGGHWSNCAILADGKVRCWGDGNSGLIGDATWAERLTPSEVPGLTSRCGDGVCDLYEMGCPAECHATSVSTGVHTCASRSEGTVWCWGNNSSGELAAGMTWHAVTAPYPATVLRDVIAVGVSYSSAYQMGAALTGAGQVWRWPEDRNAGLFDPVPVPLAGNAIHLGVGQHHTCVVLAGGAVWCWGGGWEGQLGTGSTSPAEVEDPVLATVVTGAASVAAGDLHTCAVLSGGAVRCWGGNQQGQCGSGDTTSPQLSGVTVSGLTAATVAPGGTHTCALGTGGTVSCWGANGSGQCGTGAQSGPVLVPTAVNLGQGATALAAGVSFTCAVLVDGTVRCWGSNDSGQLGDGNGGSVPYSPAPVVVAGLDDVVEVACGIMTTCARKTDHSLWCWGGNYQGQLGDGTQLDRTSPVQVLPLSW
jgi:cysteine-rich repeat protein